jgi:histidine triad (HIT) family protein
MSLDGAYDPDNIFARLIRGEIRSAKIFETDRVLAFMDAFPQSKGHCLVVHKASRARNLLDAEPEVLDELILAVQRIARAVKSALRPDGIVVTQFNGALAGQTVYHLHFHLIPRFEGEAVGRHAAGAMADMDELEKTARLIASAL